jgi:hypothetical protein
MTDPNASTTALPAPVDGDRVIRWVRTEARAVWQDIRSAPLAAAGIVLGTLALLSTLGAGITTALTTGDPFAAVDAAYGAFFGNLFGYAAAMICAALVSGLVGALAWSLPRRLTHTTARRGAPRRAGRWALLAMAWTIVAGSLILAGTLSSLLTVAVLVSAVAGTATWRARRSILRWLLGELANTAGEFNPDAAVVAGWKIQKSTWSGRKLVAAEIAYPDALRAADALRRSTIEQAVSWAMRFQADSVYSVKWPPGTRRLVIAAEPPLPEYVAPEDWPSTLPGLVVGVTDTAHADVVITVHGTTETIPVVVYDPESERDLLVCGPKGSGKTVFVRRLIRDWLAKNPGRVWILDGKGGADYAYFDGIDRVVVVARNADMWDATFTHLIADMTVRYEANYEWQAGRGPKPNYESDLIILDEVQQILRALGAGGKDPFDSLARMARAARQRMIVVTQRPDTADAIPGAIRDQLEDRVAFGWMSEQGSRMMLGNLWRAITGNGDPNVEIKRPRGRGIALIRGKLSPIQAPAMPTPVEDPSVAWLYPPHIKGGPTVIPKPVIEDPVVPTQRQPVNDQPAPVRTPEPATQTPEPATTTADSDTKPPGRPRRKQRRTD